MSFPANNIDAGPSQGRLPTDPFLVNGPVVNRALLNSMFPPGTLQKNTGTVQFDNPDRTVPYTRQASVGYEQQIGTAMAASVDYIRNDLKDLYLRQDLNPGTRASTARTAAVTAAQSQLHRIGPRNHQPGMGELEFAAVQPGQALLARLPVPRVLHAVEHVRQHRRRPA